MALGLGEIKISSGLNQRLSAEIPMFSLRPNDVDGMQIVLGSAEQFRRAGVARPFSLTKLRFQTEDFGDGKGVIRVSTQSAVNEPFLDFLVEVNWPSGRLVREFTVLLDPPVYGAAIRQTVARTVPTVQPSAPTAAGAAVALPRRPSINQPSSNTGTRSAASGQYGPVKRKDTLWALSSRLRPDRSVTLQQMMLAILQANPQAFINGNVNALRAGAILRVPTKDDVSAIRNEEALAYIRQQNTEWDEVRRSLAANVAERPARTPVAAPSKPEPSDSQADAGAEQTAATLPAEIDTEGKLRIDGAGTGNAVGEGEGAKIDKLSEQADLAREELSQVRGENDDLTTKLDEAEKIIVDLERLAQIHDEQLAQFQQQLSQAQSALETAINEAAAAPVVTATVPTTTAATDSETPTPVMSSAEPDTIPATAETSATAQAPATAQTPVTPEPEAMEPSSAPAAPATPEVKALTPAVAPVVVPVTAPEPQGIVDEIAAMAGDLDPTLLVGGGGFIIVLLGLLMYLRRKKAAAGSESATLEEVMLDHAGDDDPTRFADGSEPTEMQPTEALFDEAETHTVAVLGDDEMQEMPRTMRADKLAQEDDPLQEANVYLAYERFDQAEEIVKKAIAERPGRPEYRVKLLEIYQGMRNRPAFDTALGELEAEVGADSPIMRDAQALAADFPAGDGSGTGVDPELGGAAGSGDTLDGGIDFDLGFAVGDASDVDPIVPSVDAEEKTQDNVDEGEIDFDLGALPMGDLDDQDSEGITVDFAVDSADEGVEADLGASADIDFDLGLDDDLDASGDTSGAKTQLLDLDIFGDDDKESDSSKVVAGLAGAAGVVAVTAAAVEGAKGLDLDLDFFGDDELTQDAETLVAGPADADTRSATSTYDLDIDFDLDFDTDLTADTTDTESLQAAVPEAFETVQLDASEAVLGSIEDGVDLDFDDELDSAFAGARDTLDTELVFGDGDLTEAPAAQPPQDLIDTVLLGPTGNFDTSDDDLLLLDDDLELNLPASDDEEAAEISLGTLGNFDPFDAGDDDLLVLDDDLDLSLPASEDEETAEVLLDMGDLELDSGDDELAIDLLEDDSSVVDGASHELLFDFDNANNLGNSLNSGDDTDDETSLELPADVGGASGELTVQMPGDADLESESDDLDLDLSTDDGFELPVDSDSALDMPVFGDDVGLDLLPEETADISGISLEPEATNVAEFSLDGSDTNTPPALDFDLGAELDSGLEETEDEVTVDLQGSDMAAPALDDIHVPPDAFETQSFLGTIDNADEPLEEMPTVVLDSSLGRATDSLELEFDALGIPEESAYPIGSDSIDFDFSDFDPLAAAQASADDLDLTGDAADDNDRGAPTRGLGNIDDEDVDETIALGNALSRDVDAVQTKLELAEEFVQLGDSDSAREALDEVLAEGSEEQVQAARALMERL